MANVPPPLSQGKTSRTAGIAGDFLIRFIGRIGQALLR